MITTTTTQAERWADEHGFTNGQVWHTDSGGLRELLEDSGAEQVYQGQESWAYQWADGSVLYAVGDWWDLAPSLKDASVPCGYCTAGIPLAEHEGVPDSDDPEAWQRLGLHHADGCEWTLTRAHRREDGAWFPDEIRAWVERHGGNVSAMARRLRIGRTHLQHLLSGRERPSRALIAHMKDIDQISALLARIAELEARPQEM
jgi:hypothetical protein